MAKEQITRLRDDMNGSTASQTIYWRWGDQDLMIDLNDKNCATFHDVVKPFRAASQPDLGDREDSPVRHRRALAPKRGHLKSAAAAAKEHNKTVRGWLLSKGVPVPPRGRIPIELEKCFTAHLAGRPYEFPEKYRPVPQQRAATPASSDDDGFVFATEPASATAAGLPQVDPGEAKAARGQNGRRIRQGAPVTTRFASA